MRISEVNMRERLFDYHQRINREARERRRANHQSVEMIRIRAKIRELNAKISTATASASSETSPAMSAMLDQRRNSYAAIRSCVAITPEVRGEWLNEMEKT